MKMEDFTIEQHEGYGPVVRGSNIEKVMGADDAAKFWRWMRGQTTGGDTATGEALIYADDLRRYILNLAVID